MCFLDRKCYEAPLRLCAETCADIPFVHQLKLFQWLVGGKWRLGVVATRSLSPGEEMTVDCNAQLYSRRAMSCFCECKTASRCRGIIQSASLNSRTKQDNEMYIQNKVSVIFYFRCLAESVS